MTAVDLSKWFDFLPALNRGGVQQLTVTNAKTEMRLAVCPATQDVFEQNLRTLMGEAPGICSRFVSGVFTTHEKLTDTQRACYGAFAEKVENWTKDLETLANKLEPLGTIVYQDSTKDLDFINMQTYCANFATLVSLSKIWCTRSLLFRSIEKTRSSLALSEKMVPFKVQLERIRKVFTIALGCVECPDNFYAIDLYARGILQRRRTAILPAEIEWARGQYAFISSLTMPFDFILEQSSRQMNTLEYLEKVLQRVGAPVPKVPVSKNVQS